MAHCWRLHPSTTGLMTSQGTRELPWWSSCKEPICNAGTTGDTGSIPGLGRPPGRGNGNPLQYSCLENPMDRGAWQATVHRVTKSQTWLKWLSTLAHTHAHMHTPRKTISWNCQLKAKYSTITWYHLMGAHIARVYKSLSFGYINSY